MLRTVVLPPHFWSLGKRVLKFSLSFEGQETPGFKLDEVYSHERLHQSLNCRPPARVYFSKQEDGDVKKKT
jgi:hypothetical protein